MQTWLTKVFRKKASDFPTNPGGGGSAPGGSFQGAPVFPGQAIIFEDKPRKSRKKKRHGNDKTKFTDPRGLEDRPGKQDTLPLRSVQ